MLPVYIKVALSITPEPVCNTSQTDSGWMLNIMKYLQTREVPRDEKQAHKLHIQATSFTLINDQLYRRSFGGSYLKCLSEPGAKYVMAKLHQGVCDNHPGGHTLAHCAYTQGKWVEAKAYANIKDKDVSKFVWKNIVCRFRVPQAIVTDNGPQFDTYRTTSKRPTGATPFALAYGMEAIIPTKIGMPIVKTIVQDQRDNNEELIRQLDFIDKLREDAAIRIASYHQRAIAQYNKRARPRFFRPGSLVLRKVFKNTTEVGARKLQCNWKGSYVVTKAGDSGYTTSRL
ncbi:hypothetical protein CK203_111595 [Vitis vinifera]|uniref:Integrase catalytic domain-containing protein n=1 Tax=Vitis vinifera TaxID=29760 RepID=A0A438FD34_VITVI|nr:hypothetical protein CK203_111595 [Vitis vinifera]